MKEKFDEESRLTPEKAMQMYLQETNPSKKGKLKIFLGYAPGVGKTFTMLAEANRLAGRGKDVVIGYFEPHGRPDTIAQLGNLVQIPLKEITYNGIQLYEMDTEAVIKRKPKLVLVDELAHTNAPGMKYKKRYEDVQELLDNGINVYSTVNLQHLESLNDIIEKITTIHVKETLPDRVLDTADEVVVVDIQPSTLRNRLQRGSIYKLEKVPAALEHFFRPGNLNALRELTLRRAADEVDADLDEYRQIHEIRGYWHTTERVLVAITSSEVSQRLIRIGARLDQRLKGEFYVAYVHCTHKMAAKESPEKTAQLEKNLELAKNLGARIIQLEGKSVSEELLKFAEERQVTKFVVGHTKRSRLQRLFRGSTTNKFIDSAEDIEIIVAPFGTTY